MRFAMLGVNQRRLWKGDASQNVALRVLCCMMSLALKARRFYTMLGQHDVAVFFFFFFGNNNSPHSHIVFVQMA